MAGWPVQEMATGHAPMVTALAALVARLVAASAGVDAWPDAGARA